MAIGAVAAAFADRVGRGLGLVDRSFVDRRFVDRSFVPRRFLVGQRRIQHLLLGVDTIVGLVDAHDQIATRDARPSEGRNEEARWMGTKGQAVSSRSARIATPSIRGEQA
jgi:hypothetical protein